MDKHIEQFIQALIDSKLIESVGEAKLLARIIVPGQREFNWLGLVETAALRAAHKKGV